MAPTEKMEDIPETTTGTLDDNGHVFTYSNADANRLLGAPQSEVSFLSIPSAVDLRRRYEFESRRFVNLELHLTTLIEYHRNQRIPRGMRTQSRPNLYSQEPEFRIKCEQIANKFAFDMILLNIEFLRKDLKKVQDKKEDLEKLLKDVLSPEDYEKFMLRNENFLQKHRNELQDLKRRKWYRDIHDYQQGRVYNWTMTMSRPMGPYKGPQMSNVDAMGNNESEDLFLGLNSPLVTPRGQPGGAAGNDQEHVRTRFQKANYQDKERNNRRMSKKAPMW